MDRNGVKELTLDMSNNNTYKLPSYIFDCPTLRHLKLFNCVFKPPTSFLGFQKLTNLYLEKIKAPLLVSLTLKYCLGTQYLNIVASRLKYLVVYESLHLELNCFTNCKNLVKLVLLGRFVGNQKYGERSTLEKLLRLPTLQLDLFFLELLSAHTVPKGLPVVLRCVWVLSLSIDFGKLDQTSFTLQLIRGSSNLIFG
nr:uncharacterized protein LOC108946776 [Nicotiana tomentosiformis]